MDIYCPDCGDDLNLQMVHVCNDSLVFMSMSAHERDMYDWFEDEGD